MLQVSESDEDLVLYIPKLNVVTSCPLPPTNLVPHWSSEDDETTLLGDRGRLTVKLPKLTVYEDKHVDLQATTFLRGERSIALSNEIRQGDSVQVILNANADVPHYGLIRGIRLLEEFVWPINLSQQPVLSAGLKLPERSWLGKDTRDPMVALIQLSRLKDTLDFEEMTSMLSGQDSEMFGYWKQNRCRKIERQGAACLKLWLSEEIPINRSSLAMVSFQATTSSGVKAEGIGHGILEPVQQPVQEPVQEQPEPKDTVTPSPGVPAEASATTVVATIKLDMLLPSNYVSIDSVSVTTFPSSFEYHQLKRLLNYGVGEDKAEMHMAKLPLWLLSICGKPGLSLVRSSTSTCPVDRELAAMSFEERSGLFLNLNREQFAVLKAALTTSRLTLVQGPPGTGKSRLQAICTEVCFRQFISSVYSLSNDVCCAALAAFVQLNN
jgi:hypothetical protein